MPYIGRDGLTHQETRIDWDEVTKISTFPRMPKKEFDKLMRDVKQYQISCLERVIEINPALAGEQYQEYVIRDFEKMELRWDVDLLKGRLKTENPLTSIFFSAMAALLERRQEAFNNHDLSLKTPQVNK